MLASLSCEHQKALSTSGALSWGDRPATRCLLKALTRVQPQNHMTKTGMCRALVGTVLRRWTQAGTWAYGVSSRPVRDRETKSNVDAAWETVWRWPSRRRAHAPTHTFICTHTNTRTHTYKKPAKSPPGPLCLILPSAGQRTKERKGGNKPLQPTALALHR